MAKAPVQTIPSAAKPNRIKEFRSLIKRAVLLNPSETALFDTIPDVLLERILDKNFNDNMALAERVLLNKYHEIDKLDRPNLDQKKRNIKHLDAATQKVLSYLMAGKKILFLTDNDNDGSMAQAVFLEFYNALPKEVQANVQRAYAQPIGASRGLNIENVEVLMDFHGWGNTEEVLVVTADIGINNRVEQDKILAAYPNMQLVVTDHHLPVEQHVVQPNTRTVVFNPQYQPTDFFKHKNISGADTLAVLLKEVLTSWRGMDPQFKPADYDRVLDNISEIATWSNLLDYVEADIVDMPLRPYTIKKALDLRSLMNVSNSMGPLVTLDWLDSDWQQLNKEAPELDVEFLKARVNEVKGLNLFAQKLLSFHSIYGANTNFNPKDFYSLLAEVVDDEDALFETPNPNYIAQLRPHIFRVSAIDNKFVFFDMLKDQMVNVYEDLRKIEKEIVRHLQKADLLVSLKSSNSTTVYPKSAHLTRIFSRKLLNKIYNEENNGFYLTLDKTVANEYSGSMRALYPIHEILADKEDLENQLNINIEVLGHSKAAGFKIIPRSGTTITNGLLKKLNNEISNRIDTLKLEEKKQVLPFLSIDFASVDLVQKINTAVKGHLSNMNSLPCVLRLGTYGASTVSVTDPKTSKQLDLAEVVNTRKYGYQAVQTDFSGNAFVIPVEQIRTLVNEKFKPVVKMSYMDDGVFIAHQVVDPKSMKNLVEFKGDRTEQESLIGYYESEYRDSNFIPLGREDFQNLPYFRYNSYGQSEFEHWEQLIISILDETDRDVFAVIDTEGTGLGQAPKCFNIGGTNIRIQEGSGFVVDEDDFDHRVYRDGSGQAYLLTEQTLMELVPVDATTVGGWRVFKTNTHGGTSHEEEFVLDKKPETTIKLNNYSRKGGEVFCNRTLEGFAFAFIVKDKDFKVTKEFENLTGISQSMVDRQGMETSLVDERLTEYFQELTNADGDPAKVIFSAHNLPYDKGILSANFVKFNELVDEHVLCDSARLSRSAKLAYDDTPVASFENVSAIPAASKVYFYDSPYSSYSLTTFLDRVVKGKGGVYPDTTGRYLLRYNSTTEEMSFIDKKEMNEVLLEDIGETLMAKKVVSSMPNNAVKYSVQSLSMRAMIRNIILHDYQKPQLVGLTQDEIAFETALNSFQDQYHFDNTLDQNIRFFLASRHNKDEQLSREVLFDVGQRFLDLNKDTQAKFHDGWIYHKVLALYEPAINEGKVPQDALNQVNYYTDLPRKKIEKVLSDTIKFKKKFGVAHALVHEQHNNIRQRSVDGQGLSDTAYESVLPTMLAMMKFYNPYTQSSPEAVSAIIETNLKGAMLQLMVKKDHQDLAAVDSFSMKQMTAFDRDNHTSLVSQAQQWMKSGGWDGKNTPIRFKLKGDVLPPGSGVYGTPKRALTETEIEQASEKLNFILINEQIRTAASLSRSISVEHGERLRNMASYNDDLALEYRNDLMKIFDRVEFQRKEATIKNLSKVMDAAFQGKDPAFTETVIKEIRKNPDLLVTAAALQVTHHMIEQRLGRPSFLSPTTAKKVADFLDTLTELVHADDAVGSGKGVKRSAVAKSKKVVDEFDGSPVRNLLFLPELDIRRDEPMKFILEKIGPRFLSTYMRATMDQPQVPTTSKFKSM